MSKMELVEVSLLVVVFKWSFSISYHNDGGEHTFKLYILLIFFSFGWPFLRCVTTVFISSTSYFIGCLFEAHRITRTYLRYFLEWKWCKIRFFTIVYSEKHWEYLLLRLVCITVFLLSFIASTLVNQDNGTKDEYFSTNTEEWPQGS